ncbi:MAG: hypothetical protein U0990_09535 [Candidatus Nanopelagicales bacterium]|nr:hypothetical protein [Candidatus Nanopelagicales bacterium]
MVAESDSVSGRQITICPFGPGDEHRKIIVTGVLAETASDALEQAEHFIPLGTKWEGRKAREYSVKERGDMYNGWTVEIVFSPPQKDG